MSKFTKEDTPGIYPKGSTKIGNDLLATYA